MPELIAAVNQTEIGETDKATGASNGRTFWPEARIEAIHTLGKISPKSPQVVTVLVEALTQNYAGISKVGDAAAEELAGVGPESKNFIPKLIQNLKHRDKLQYRGATMASVYPVGAFAPGEGETVPKLIQVLQGLDAQGREAAAYDLGTLRKEEAPAAKAAIPELIKVLGDNDPEVKLCAAEAIANIDPEQARANVPALVELFRIRVGRGGYER